MSKSRRKAHYADLPWPVRQCVLPEQTIDNRIETIMNYLDDYASEVMTWVRLGLPSSHPCLARADILYQLIEAEIRALVKAAVSAALADSANGEVSI